MARSKPWGVYMGPVIFVVGLVGFWGTKSAFGLRDRVEGWAYQLEHSSEPVVMEMPNIPAIPPLIINNRRVGRIETIIVQRDRPNGVDSVSLIASLRDGYGNGLEDCNLRFRLRLNGNVDLGDLKRAFRCTSDVEGLVPFGSLAFEDSDMSLPIFVRVDDLPCDNSDVDMGPCRATNLWQTELREGMLRLREELRHVTGEARAQVLRAEADIRRAELEVARAAAEAQHEAMRARVQTKIR